MVKSEALSVLPFARVEHIGSSAVPVSIEKGDLDIFVGVETGMGENVIFLY